MLLENYSLEIFNSACNPNAASVHCYARLEQDEWLKTEINEAWDRRDGIAPSRKSAPRPQIIEILKLLPKTNCRECREPTCMVFALRVAEGVKDGRDCPALDSASEKSLDAYLSRFNLDC